MTPEERFWARVDASGDCWEWQGHTTSRGYGQVSWDGRDMVTHRVSYALLVGTVPEGLVLDHLCQNRRCVNPDHLEPVDQRTNILRGHGAAARAASRLTCIRGHEFVARPTPNGHGRRICLTCRAEFDRRRRAAA